MQLHAISMQLQAIARQSPVNQADNPGFAKTRAQNGAKSAETPFYLQRGSKPLEFPHFSAGRFLHHRPAKTCRNLQ